MVRQTGGDTDDWLIFNGESKENHLDAKGWSESKPDKHFKDYAPILDLRSRDIRRTPNAFYRRAVPETSEGA